MKLTARILLVLSILLPAASMGDSKDLKFEVIDNSSGLPENEIRRIHKDREGLMWFASYNGLLRYDGYEFKVFKNTKSTPSLLHSNFITELSDDESRIWIGTDNGLNYLDKRSGRIFPSGHERLDKAYVYGILHHDGYTYFATSDGLFRLSEKSSCGDFSEISIAGIKSKNYSYMYIDSEGWLWLNISRTGLVRYHPRSRESISCGKENINVMFEDDKGNFWISYSGKGVRRFRETEGHTLCETGSFRTSKKEQSLGSNTVYSIRQDELSGDIWFGHRNGISILEPPYRSDTFMNWIYDGSAESIPYNDVSDIYQDSNGTMWLATIGGGICRISLRDMPISNLRIPHMAEKYGTEYITALYSNSDEDLWIGLKNKGLVRYNPHTERFTDPGESRIFQTIPSNEKIHTICPINDRSIIMIGTESHGIYRIRMDGNGQTVSIMNMEPWRGRHIISNNIHSIFQATDRTIWVGNGRTISLMSDTFKSISRDLMPAELRSQYACFCEDGDGSIWAGSRTRGVVRIDRDGEDLHFTEYNIENGKIGFNNISSVLADTNGEIWGGTLGGGLYKYDRDSDRFISVNDRYNIPQDDIFNLFQDSRGSVWVSTSNALIRIGTEKRATRIFHSTVFPNHNVFVQKCNIARLDDDTYALGGMKGISILNLGEVNDRKNLPPIVLTDIMVGYNSVFGDDGESSAYQPGELTLKHNQKNFAIKFASLSYELPHRDQYSYRLLGYETDWNYVGTTQRIANYTNIPRGRYEFQVRAAGSGGEWMEDHVSLHIRIRPSPFRTATAYICYFVLFCMLGWTVSRFVLNKIRLRNRLRIAEMDKIRNEELTRSKLRFFTNVSHEFLTPLTIIKCSAENIHASGKEEENDLAIIGNNVARLQSLIHQVLDFNKAESGKLKLNVREGDLSEMLQSICTNDFRVLAAQRNISLTWDIAKTVSGWYDADKVDKIVTNLLSNAFKYNYDNSFVHVSLSEDYDEDNRYAVIRIKDGGTGIAPEKIDRIFERFYEADYRDTKSEGTGIGLALTKALVELHKGEIKVESALGKGSMFQVTVPINRNAYTDEERASKSHVINDLKQAAHIAEGKSLLIVEDNDELRYVMTRTLSRYFIVDQAANGQEAVEKLRNASYDLVITDIMMPVMDGNELCRFIKTNLDYSHIPVIMLTAKHSAEDKITSYDNGADAFISKPFPMSLLISRIGNLFKGKELILKKYKDSDESIHLQDITYTSLDQKFIEDAIRVVEANLSNEQFGQEEFVAEMNVSKSTLYRKIKSLAGMSINEFIKDIRLKQACKIMREQAVSISEIAYLVGFEQPKYFTYCFKKKYGILPSEYMEKHARQRGK